MAAVLSSILDEFRSIKSVSDLVSWRSPKATGIVAGGIAFVILFYAFMEYTMVTFACRIFQIATGLGCAAGLTGKCTRDPQVVHEKIENMVDTVAPALVKGCEKLFQLVTFSNKEAASYALIASFVIGFLGNLMSDIVFVFIAFAITFISPIVYEKKKKEINEVLAKVRAFLEKNIPMLKTRAEDIAKKAE